MIAVPSKYQADIFTTIQETTNSIIVSAGAGSGKTSTIEYAVRFIPKHKDCIYLAFNRIVVEEARRRLPTSVVVSTLHSYGCKMFMRQVGRATLDENKCFKLALKMFRNVWKADTIENIYTYCYRVSRLVDLMRLTLTTEREHVQQLADRYSIMVFEKEIEHSLQLFKLVSRKIDTIDFVDMIYQPAVRDIKFPKFDYVLVDEIQDLNKCQQVIVKKLIRPNSGRLIGVGDPNQSIYGFAGADYTSYERMKTLVPNTVELPLSVCYRCPKEVVKSAQEIVPSLEVFEGQAEGSVIKSDDINLIKPGDWVLCRNVRPLVQLFRKLVSQNKKANIRGREIGKDLVNLIEKTKKPLTKDVIKMLEVHQIRLRSKLRKYGFAKPEEHPQMVAFVEKLAIIKMFSEGIQTTKRLVSHVESIFLDKATPDIVLSTIHKAKGLEAKNIFIMYEHLIPSRYATTKEELVQEMNLKYVARTRAKQRLIFFNPNEDDLQV